MPSSPTRSTYTVFQFPKARSPCATRRSLMGHPTSSRPLASETRSLGNKNLSSFTDVLLLTRYLGMPRPPTATLAIRTLLTSFRDQIHVQVFFCAFTFHDRPAEVAFIISSAFQPPVLHVVLSNSIARGQSRSTSKKCMLIQTPR